MKFDYIRDPAKIYEESFSLIRQKTDFRVLPEKMRPVALRLVHATGMPDLIEDFVYSPEACQAGIEALGRGRPILTDTEMVRHGIIAKALPADNQVICTLNHPEVSALSIQKKMTRSAVGVDFWASFIDGAVVAIGNAPTALFRLLENLETWSVRPALILGFPVGFVGAAESKEALIEWNKRHREALSFMTLRGYRGGSAMASAAVNALVCYGFGPEGIPHAGAL